MPVFTFQSSGPASLDSLGQRDTPSDGPRIAWYPTNIPPDGFYHVGDLCINTLTGLVSVCTVEGTGGGDTWVVVGTQT